MRHRAGRSKHRLLFKSATLLGLALAVAATLASGVLAGEPPSGPQTITLSSGSTPATFSISGGASGNAAVYSVNTVSGSRCHTLWATPVAGTSWIGASSNCANTAAVGTPSTAKTTDYAVAFVLPAGFADPSISVSLHADNVGTVFLNGTQIGTQPGCCPLSNFQDPPEVFASSNAALFQAGSNTLVFRVADHGTVTGLDFRAVVSFTAGPTGLDHFVLDPIADPQTAGVPFGVVVTAYDSNGNVKTDYSGPATFGGLGDSPGGCGGPCSPVYALTFVNGVASGQVTTFKAESDVAITVEDTGTSIQATSNTFSVEAGAPDSLVFGQQPTRTLVDEVITPAPTVIVLDAYGNIATQASDPVTMAIGQNPGAGNLLGTVSQSAVQGVATFDDLVVDESGDDYTLVATAPVESGTASATSDEFDVPNVIVECGTGGCSGTAANSSTTVTVNAPPLGGGSARALTGAAGGELAIMLNAPGESFECAGATSTAIGSIVTVDPPPGYTTANPITVELRYDRTPGFRVQRSSNNKPPKPFVCKNQGGDTPFAPVARCKKRHPVAPCEKSRSKTRQELKFVLLITSTDPRLASK